ncbi:MAG: hypothetical protein GC208_03035 [Alphaproteobacteria bacterium]|nr:hypothetical protein [Alphaproteobacteria bacterium]
MDELPETMRITQPARRDISLIVIYLVFVLLAIFLLEDKFWLSTATLVFFGGGLLVSIVHLIVTARDPDYLELDRSGWETKGIFSRRQRYRWTEGSRFGVYEQKIQFGLLVAASFVICRDLRENRPVGFMDSVARVLTPRVAGCLTPGPGYGMPAQDLADLMNRYRDAALGADGATL